MPQEISAKENPSVRLYRKLARSKKERQQTGQFVLEGYRLVRDAAAHGAAFTVLFFTADAWKRCQEDGGIAADLRETKLLLISNELAMYMGETEHPQGVFGICRIPERSFVWKPGKRYVVLYQLQDPGNMGTILRTADAMGMDGVVCCGTCDVYSPKVVRSTMGSLFRVPLMQASGAEALLEELRTAGIVSCAAVVDGDAEPVGASPLGAGCAIWIGNEGNGLPKEVSAACERRVTIPMQGTIESLNAAMAAGILMWEMVRNEAQA